MQELAKSLLTSWIDSGILTSCYKQPAKRSADGAHSGKLATAILPIARGMRALATADVGLTYIRATTGPSPLTTHRHITASDGIVSITNMRQFARPGSVFNAGAGLPICAIVLEAGRAKDNRKTAAMSLVLPRRVHNMRDVINLNTRVVVTINPTGQVVVGYEELAISRDTFDQFLAGVTPKEQILNLRGGESSGRGSTIDLAVGHMDSLRLLGIHVPRLGVHCRSMARALINGEPQSTLPRGGG